MKFDRFGPTSTRVLLAVITQPRPTVRSVADGCAHWDACQSVGAR